ncbi:tetratricopeptide repeat protein [Oscillatoriales cyanobacterium LEGE 11467]|uniref:Tetratricopeptide repeat protein n=1 Tax=Zarconia navalis LEGE 11467 TaxID=1828826 RepID=A0A928ZA42_9CYAN|nr:tetratricopeptide repeat protein [Zarconia navalis]MBE9042429.1 tetratricopeptide repeat protein [Zarconia navalis LEGE 11467]
MNPTQAYVVETRKNCQLAPPRGASSTRTNIYRTSSLRMGSHRPTRYLSRTTHQPELTEHLTENSIDIPQPKKSPQPSKPSQSNEDLASSLSAAAWNNLGIAWANLEQYDDALSAFERALTLDPTFDRAIGNARRIQHLTGEE